MSRRAAQISVAQRSEIEEVGDQIEFPKGSIIFEATLIENQRKLQFKKTIELNQNQSESFDSFMKICFSNLDEFTYIECKLDEIVNVDEFLGLFEEAGGSVTAEDENGFEGRYKGFDIIVHNDEYTGQFLLRCLLNKMYRAKKFFEQDIFSELAQILKSSIHTD